jgi:hypothetical protein
MKSHFSIILGILPALLLVGCTDFFTNSWGTWAARDPSKLVPRVTAGNVKELVSIAANNPDLSLEVLKGINKAMGGASEAEQAELQAAALNAALNASNMINAIMSNASAAGDLKDEAAVISLIEDTMSSMGNLVAAANLLVEILPVPPGQAFDDFADKASADDLAKAAALILAGKAKEAGDLDIFSDYGTTGTAILSTAEQALIEALANAAKDKYAAAGKTGDLLYGLLDTGLGLI